MAVGEGISSPRMRVLAERVANGESGVVEAFWREVEEETTPIVERDPERAEACLVTFVWRSVEPVANVVLVEWVTPGDLPTKQMTRLGETDVWYRTLRIRGDVRTEYSLAPNDSLVARRDETDWETRRANWRADPLNPKRFSLDPDGAEMPRHRLGGSVLELPDAEPLPWIGKRDGVPVGTVEPHRFASQILGNERDTWTYRPADRQPAGLLVHFDGELCRETLGLPTLLDNLIHAGAIPPIAAVMIGNVDRGNELPCSAPFARFLAEEIAPWAYDLLGAPRGPERAILAGQSYGGLAALYGALEQSDTLGNALSQSGSFWWKPNPLMELKTVLHGDAPNYATLPGEVARLPKRPIRIYMDAGTLEIRASEEGIISLLQSNRYMRDVLIAKGYEVTYHEYAGGHDYVWWRGRLADGLIALIGGR